MGKTRSMAELKEIMTGVIHASSYEALLSIGTELVAAFFIGGAILTAVMTPVTYFFVKSLVVKYRAKRIKQAEK